MRAAKKTDTSKGPLARFSKGIFTTLFCFLLPGLLSTQLIAAPYQQGTDSNDLVCIEAEGFDSNVSQGGKSWTNSYPSGYSGTGALITSPNTGTNNNTGYVTNSPRLDYVVNFVKTGVHYVWIRGAGPTGKDDSLHVGLDGVALTSSNRISKFSNGLSWSNIQMGGTVVKINVATVGEHTLNIWMREDGTVFDKIVLTTNRAYTPANKGPSASVRSTTGSASYEPVAALSSDSLNFGSQDVGGISNPSSVRLTNSGTAPLYISGITTTAGFIQTNNCNDNVSVGGSCVINVEFVPTSTGAITGSLMISSNAGSSGVVNLVGTGTNGSQPLSSLIPSGPIVISGEHDVVISGLHITNPNGSCIEVRNGATNIVIQNSEIGPCNGKGIDIVDSRGISIRNNYIHDTIDEGVMSNKSNSITVDSNRFEKVSSGYAAFSAKEGDIRFVNNFVKNVRRANRRGGNIATIVNSSGSGFRINNNIGINILGESNAEDLVNIYKSNGTPGDPIQVNNNKFFGSGESSSGGGILLADQKGSYQIAENNILVNPGQYGIAIGGGRYNTLRNNRVYSDDQRSFTNIGVVVWRFNANGNGTQPGDCYGHTIENNEITWWKGPNYKNNGLPASLAPYYNPSFGADRKGANCGPIAGWTTNKFDTKASQPANLDMSLWNPDWNNP